MGTVETSLCTFLPWLLKATVQGSVLVCLILLLKMILRQRLPVRWHYCLWLVLLVRLALPWAPASRLSLYSLIPSRLSSYQVMSGLIAPPSTEGHRGPDALMGEGDSGQPTADGRRQTAAPEQTGVDTSVTTHAPSQTIMRSDEGASPMGGQDHQAVLLVARVLTRVWLVGAVFLAGYILIKAFRLWRAVTAERPVTGQEILDLLEDCKLRMRVRTLVGVVVTDKVRTPALFGFLRPRILLPQGLVEMLGLDQLHYVFLHELAHLKRRDIYLAWLVCLLQVLHWFNPLLWLAFRRMRADQEMAADALALSAAGTDQSRLYGRTIVSLLERFSRPQYLPSLAGILENPSHIERRIQMIAQFKGTTGRPLLAMVLLALLGLITLTEAQNKSQGGQPASQPEEKTGLAPDRNAPVAPQVTGMSATETASLGGGLVLRRVLADASGVDGVLTAEGRYISHIDPITGDMVQFEVASGQTSRITNREGAAARETPYEYQVFSRDGKQIAYDSYTKDWVPQLRIRNLDGSGLRTLYSEKGHDVHPLDWSPDAGSILAFRELEKGFELILISTADGSVRVLRTMSSGAAFNDWYFQRASFSPDGRFIAFSFMREGSPPVSEVFLMTTDGRNEVVVAEHPTKNRLFGWTPDGRSLVFSSGRSGTWDLWSVRITNGKQHGEPELLTKEFPPGRVIGLAPNGSLYCMTRISSGRLYNGEVDLETGKVLVPPAPVATRYTSPQNFLTWSPDGRNLAYLSHPGAIGTGNNILTIRSAATGEERFLSPDLNGVNQISWAPDGRSIIALGFTETSTGAYRIDTETSEITKLADEGVFARLCPDGKTLVHWGEEGIIRRNLDTGEESVVVKAAPSYALSPDGREVVFQVDGAVKTMSLNGGEPRELFRGSARYYGLAWTRDGRYIIAWATDTTGSEIWRVPAQGGTPLKLDIISVPKMGFFALHPDNRRFAFSVREGSKSELWVMENFLPAGTGVKDSK